MRYDSILFDLDGTLWDSTDAVAASWEEALAGVPDIEGPPPGPSWKASWA